MKKSVTHLYESFKPAHYELKLELFPNEKSFEGTVTIKGRKAGRPSQRITLHQKDLKVISASITRHDKKTGDEELPIDRVNAHSAYDELRIHSSKMIYPGEYTVMISFKGKITDPMNGLYPCYFKHDGEEKFLLATQFESHHAREVLPCIDEPEAKATFNLTLITPDEGLEVLANTPVIEQIRKDGKQITAFETTPLMSTYLLAFAYGEIGYKQARTRRGTLVRTYATPDNVEFTGFALDTAVKVLEFYEDYFGIPYPLDKCDMIALPDFASGAMENWGLITYREQCMLVDPKNTSLPTKQYVAMVVAHELAHQWFGNLVTMRWWTDLWLNEGFASWIEYLAIDNLFPEWQMWTQFIATEQQAAFKLDALENTHPIEVPIRHPDEIRTIFDTISYSKGASVIHMLYGYLGDEDFRGGLRHYLQEHAYGNTDTSDLWDALERVSGKPIKQFMHSWTSQPGFPVVSVNKIKEHLEIKQERFYLQRPQKKSPIRWPVPLLTHAEAPERLDTASMRYPTAHFTKLNSGQSGFYRTVYTPDLLDGLAQTISEESAEDRLGLLSDAFEASKAGHGSLVSPLKLLEYYSHEDNSAVWDIIASNISEIRRIMDDDELRERIKPFIRNLTASQLKRLGFKENKNDSHFDKLLRPTILGLSASADEKTVVDWCIKTFEGSSTPADIHADLRGVVYNTAARHGDAKVFEKLLKFHNSTDLSEERTTLSAALTGFEQSDLIERSLELITSKDVRRQDAMYWVAYSFMNRHAKAATWQWMKNNWSWLDKELGSDLSFFRTPIYAARSFSSEEFKKDFEKFFSDKNTPSLERSIKQGLELLNWQIELKQRELKPLLSFFAD